MAIIMDGKLAATKIKQQVADKVANIKSYAPNCVPRLAVIKVGEDPASAVYVRQKEKACAETGILSSVFELHLGGTDTPEILLYKTEELIKKLNGDQSVHGILLQLPLPESIQYATHFLINSIDPAKDVDCLTDVCLGMMYSSKKRSRLMTAPCTASGVMRLADANKIDFAGKHCVVIGRSAMVSKPLANLLVADDATVTVCHSKTPNLGEYTKTADVIVSATGHRDLITPDMVRSGVIAFDVGIVRDENNKLHGDIHPDVQEVASYITPVPGGVGPMTVAMLMYNTLTLALRSNALERGFRAKIKHEHDAVT